jgi:peptide deformylase
VSLLGIRVLGDPVLRQDTVPVTRFDDAFRVLVADMFETMYAAEGIGLAAPQVGRSERVAVLDVKGERYVIVNPEVVLTEGDERSEEGCLSIPEVYGDVDRATHIVVRAQDEHGAPIEIDATDLLARCLLHEIDHLHGKLFIDYFGYFKRRAAISQWEKERDKYPGNVRVLSPAQVAEHHSRDEEL